MLNFVSVIGVAGAFVAGINIVFSGSAESIQYVLNMTGAI